MAQLKELSVSYSANMKVSLPQNKYESASVHVSRSETYEINEGDDPEKLYMDRFRAIQHQIGDLVVEKFNEIKGGEL